MKYFTLQELYASATARERGINNTPTKIIEDHLVELATKILDPLREKFGSPVRITSGYRCPTLNSTVGGSPRSVHMTGYAADTVPANGDMAAWQRTVLAWARTGLFDQIIIEQPDDRGVAKWIHIGIRSNSGMQRRQIFYSRGSINAYVKPDSKFYNV